MPSFIWFNIAAWPQNLLSQTHHLWGESESHDGIRKTEEAHMVGVKFSSISLVEIVASVLPARLCQVHTVSTFVVGIL